MAIIHQIVPGITQCVEKIAEAAAQVVNVEEKTRKRLATDVSKIARVVRRPN